MLVKIPNPHAYKHLGKGALRLAPLRLIAIVSLLFAPLLQISAQTVLPSGFGERQYATGLTNPQIAQRLLVSLPTVNTHVASIFNKLGVTSRSAATRFAIEYHLA